MKIPFFQLCLLIWQEEEERSPSQLPSPLLAQNYIMSVLWLIETGSFQLIFYLAAPGLRCSTQDLQLQHMGSNSLIGDRTWFPFIDSMEFQPLDHQGSPRKWDLECSSFLTILWEKSREEEFGMGVDRVNLLAQLEWR